MRARVHSNRLHTRGRSSLGAAMVEAATLHF